MNTETDIRNRISEILDVPGSLVLPNPMNWRTHPESQTSALRGILSSVGVVDVLKVVKHPRVPGSYMLIDGHARAEILGDRNVKVAVLDLSEEEQRLILATFDPVGNLSGTDQAMLDSLLDGLNVEDTALLSLMEGIHSFDPTTATTPGSLGDVGKKERTAPLVGQFAVIVACDDEQHQERVFTTLVGMGYTVKVVCT